MKLEVGKSYKTRDGQRAVVVKYERCETNREYLVWLEKTEDTLWFYEDGRRVFDTVTTDDLISEWREPRTGEFCVNVYDDNEIAIHGTTQSANEAASKGRLACVQVKWTEGEGL